MDKSKLSSAVIAQLEMSIKCHSSVFAHFGVPARPGVPYSLVSINAKKFTNDKITYMLENQGCKKVEFSQYAPRSNGIAERANGEDADEGVQT